MNKYLKLITIIFCLAAAAGIAFLLSGTKIFAQQPAGYTEIKLDFIRAASGESTPAQSATADQPPSDLTPRQDPGLFADCGGTPYRPTRRYPMLKELREVQENLLYCLARINLGEDRITLVSRQYLDLYLRYRDFLRGTGSGDDFCSLLLSATGTQGGDVDYEALNSGVDCAAAVNTALANANMALSFGIERYADKWQADTVATKLKQINTYLEQLHKNIIDIESGLSEIVGKIKEDPPAECVKT